MKAALRLLVVLLSVASFAYAQTYTEGPWTYTVDFSNPSAGKARITRYSGSDSTVVIPSMLGGASVVAFDASVTVFSGKMSITSVAIPDTVTHIASRSFQQCINLTNVNFGSNVQSFGEAVFSGCRSLTNMALPHGVTRVSANMFNSCTGLTNVTIPNSVTNIGNFAFYRCTSLSRLTIPASVTSIETSAFRECHALTNIRIPAAVTNIETLVFRDCTSLTNIEVDLANTRYVSQEGVLYNKPPTAIVEVPLGLIGSVTIPDGVTNLGSAFRGRTGLTSITIGGGVTSINDSAFDYCTGLTNVTVPTSVTNIGATAFQATALKSVYFQGNMPLVGGAIFAGITPVGTVFYPRGNKTWGASYAGWPTQPYDLPTPQPVLELEHPSGAKLMSGASAIPFPTSPIGISSPNHVYTMRNTGNAVLSNIAVAKSGPNSADFYLTPPASNTLVAGATTTFSVTFLPASSGTRTAQVSITSNDTNNSPFLINLSGTAVSASVDTDKDGLNDAAELTMSALGFNWQNSQPALVDALMSNANQANLFTKTQFDANRTNGRADVTGNPSAYSLFTQTQYNNFGALRFSNGQTSVRTNPAGFNLVSRTNIPPVRLAVPKNAAFTLNLGGTWTRHGLTGRDRAWTFNTNTGELKGTLVGTNERTLRLVPYNGSQAGPQMIIQLRPAP